MLDWLPRVVGAACLLRGLGRFRGSIDHHLHTPSTPQAKADNRLCYCNRKSYEMERRLRFATACHGPNRGPYGYSEGKAKTPDMGSRCSAS
jgi:hypothetical protein